MRSDFSATVERAVLIATPVLPPAEVGLAFRFEVTSRKLKGGFSRVGGIKEEIEVDEKRDGVLPFLTRKNIGVFKGGTLELSKGVIRDFKTFITWFNQVKEYDSDFRDTVYITIKGTENQGITRIGIFQAWPIAYEIKDLDGQASEIAVESITIVFEEMTVVRL